MKNINDSTKIYAQLECAKQKIRIINKIREDEKISSELKDKLINLIYKN